MPKEFILDNDISFGYKLSKIYNFQTKILPSITIQVTDDCCCACAYCYEANKKVNVMTIETADKIVNQIFDLYELDKPELVINKSIPGLCIDFMGGEPLMNMPVIDYISSAILNKCIQLNHPWLGLLRFHITTNGVLYFTPEVQSYIKKFEDFIDIAISIDGPKHVHDMNRIFLNKTGTFDMAYAALKDWQSRGHFVTARPTISPNTLPYLFDTVKFFFDNDIYKINCAFIQEHQWTIEEAKICYEQKKKIADYVIENHIDINNLMNIFFPKQGQNIQKIKVANNEFLSQNLHCLSSILICYSPDGSIYPCTRINASTLGEELSSTFKLQDGKDFQLDFEKWKSLSKEERIEPDECKDCFLIDRCPQCLGPSIEEGDYHKRSKSRCHLNKATALVSSYFFNKYYRTYNKSNRFVLHLSKEESLNYISEQEYEILKKMEED